MPKEIDPADKVEMDIENDEEERAWLKIAAALKKAHLVIADLEARIVVLESK